MSAYYPLLIEATLVLVNFGFLIYLASKYRVSLLNTINLPLERIKRSLGLLLGSLPSVSYYCFGYSSDTFCLMPLWAPVIYLLTPLTIQVPPGFKLRLHGQSVKKTIEIHLNKASDQLDRHMYRELFSALKLLKWAGVTQASMTSPLFINKEGQPRNPRFLDAQLSALDITATGRFVQPSFIQRFAFFWGRRVRKHDALQPLSDAWYHYDLLIEDTTGSADPAQLHNRPLD